MLQSVFLTVLSMSFTASLAILIILPVRLLLKPAPKIFSYALWAVVLFRLLCPISISSDFSLIGFFNLPITESAAIEYIPGPIINEPKPLETDLVFGPREQRNDFFDQGTEPIPNDSGFNFKPDLSLIWILGASIMLFHNLIKLKKLEQSLIGALPLRNNIYLADHIESPLVIGLVSPKIFLPSSLNQDEQEYIILHEQHHIKRYDHLTRILSFLALCLHWFNPLVWLAFNLSGKDMEMSCDEAVLSQTSKDIRQEYSSSLLQLTREDKALIGGPLAFAERDTKERIKNVMNYKKPLLWVVVISVILTLVLTACLGSNPKVEESPEDLVFNLNELDFDSLNLTDHPGIGFPLIYESDDLIIFYGDFGLFGYSLKEQTMVFQVDFIKAYGETGLVQGEYGTSVGVSADGQNLVLSYQDPDSPETQNDSYFIDLTTFTYQKGPFQPLPEPFPVENIVGSVMPLATIEDTLYILGDQEWRVFVQPDLEAQLTYRLSQLFNQAYRPYYEKLSYKISDYTEVIEAEDFTSTFLWTMRHLDSGGDIPSEAGKGIMSNFILQARGSLQEGKLAEVEFFGDVSAQGPSDFSAPLESFFPDENSQLTLTGYIKEINTITNRLLFDQVFWLSPLENEELLEELGMDPLSLPNPYYIYNPEESHFSYFVREDASVKILERDADGNLDLVPSTLENLTESLNTRARIYTIKVKNAEIIEIAERYTP